MSYSPAEAVNSTTGKELEDISKRVKENELRGVKAEIDGYFTSIAGTKPKNKVPEAVFVEVFLEYFKNTTEYDGNNTIILKWIELTGSPYNEVDVINDKGDVIYTVPGFFDRPSIDDIAAGEMDFGAVAKKFTLKTGRLASDGVNYLNAELSKVPKAIKNNEDNTSALRWANIFSLYEKQKPGITVDKAHLIPAAPAADLYDFD